MSTINRFTQIEPTKYSPRTLQELMMVPMYKRGQHDALDEKRETIAAAISQLDPLDVHYDRAMSEQKKIMDQLNSQAEQLQQKGFSRTSTSDFQRLNKQYQQAISPTGDLGKIQTAKKAAETEKATILANAIQMGHDPIKTQKRIDEAYAKYGENFTKTGKIENFKAPLPPKYENLEKDLQWIKSMAGSTVETSKGKEGYNLKFDPILNKVVAITTSGQIITKDNKNQLGAGLKILTEKWLTEGGAGYNSAQWNEIPKEQLINTITDANTLMRQNEIQNTLTNNYQFIENPSGKGNTPMPRVTEKPKTIAVGKKDTIDNLNRLGTLKPSIVYKTSNTNLGFVQDTEKSMGKGETYKYADLSDSEKSIYKNIALGLVRAGIIDNKTPYDDPELIKLVTKRLNQSAEMTYADKILKPLAIDNSVMSTLGIKSSSQEEADRNIKAELNGGRMDLYDENGIKVDHKKIYPDATFDYVGYKSGDNMELPRGQMTADMLVAPHRVTVYPKSGGSIELYGSRDAGDKNTPQFQALKTIKDITLNSKLGMSELPNRTESAQLKQLGISEIQTTYIPNINAYYVKIKDINGNVENYNNKPISSEDLQSEIFSLFGVK